MYSGGDTQGLLGWVSPFGNLRVNGHLRLSEAYRSLSRPSSPADAKASPVCPCLLPITPSVFRKDQSGTKFRSASRFQHQEPIINQPCSVSKKLQELLHPGRRLATASFDKAVLLKMLVSHKEYGSIEKDLMTRGGDIVVTLSLREGGQVKESRKKVGQVTFQKAASDRRASSCIHQ
jgi:hypothetical protein